METQENQIQNLKKLLNTKNNVHQSFSLREDSDLNFTSYAVSVFNSLFNSYPSQVDYPFQFKGEVNEYLAENGLCILRKLNQEYPQFVYKYENCIVIVTNYASTKRSRVVVFFNNNEIPPTFDDFIFSNDNEASVGILKKNSYGEIEVENVDFSLSTTLNPADHYNDDFPYYMDQFISKLEQKESGLFLLHGFPGTGKSEFCKHLLHLVNRQFIFIPPALVGCLATPEFNELLTNTHRGSVLIIEDAEKALMKRTQEDGFHNSDLVSTVLNLTDGIFGDLTKISILATYNCDRSMIDEALLRKGRLKVEYEFKKLSVKKAQNLMDKLGRNVTVSEEMTLSDIFNYEDQATNNVKEVKKIGFGS